METRWTTVDGVTLELPTDCTVEELREALHKPSDAVLVAVTGDLVSVVHDEDRPLSEMVAGCANKYYFWRDDAPERTEIPSVPKLEAALDEPSSDETTFQRPGVDY